MSSDRSADATVEATYVSTGRLPSPDIVRALVSDAHERFGSNRDGAVSETYPALAKIPEDLFGLCVVGVSGAVYASGDWDIPFSIMSVSKPFVFALVLQMLGADEARRRCEAALACQGLRELKEHGSEAIPEFALPAYHLA